MSAQVARLGLCTNQTFGLWQSLDT